MDKNFKRINKCLAMNEPGLNLKLEELGYHRRGENRGTGIIVYPETNEYEELPYPEIEFKEGWIDCFDEVDLFLMLASEEYYELKYRPGINKFSLVSPYWTDIYYSEDPKDWEEDLKEHKKFEFLEDESPSLSMYINEEYGGFGLECNSLEEMEELSSYFWDRGFVNQLQEKCIREPRKSRLWYNVSDKREYILMGSDVNLYLFPLKFSDYPKLRRTLLDLWKIGYLVKYQNGYIY